jgi:hypothetical protein
LETLDRPELKSDAASGARETRAKTALKPQSKSVAKERNEILAAMLAHTAPTG